ncbi:Sas10 C-terminal domain-containing protein [Staphylotrichum tortipilum]|uniref:Sas10 C-terminal domain-containing protein n=1 Tax=Staphylotrichum tortipilum TaxID=2831512 RepID=A0AAN6MIP3_9PEZI|nr:Sas10 C-terminal domain-containing protein [Staphylotrichum longicolle]
MAKKRKVSRKSEPSGPRDVDAKDARLTIKTYEDVADSEDEYWAKQDRIDFDDDDGQPRSKRLKRQEKEDAFLEASDEEIFGEELSDESDEEEEEEAPTKRKADGKVGARDEDVSDVEQRGGEEEEGDEGWWGSSKKEYYDADNIETEADALEEEAEARRLQAKKLAKMQEADFAFDESEWAAPKDQEGEEEVVTEVLQEVEVTEDMGPDERYKLLQARYPEFDYLVDEFRELQPLLPILQKDAEGKPAKSLEVIKSWLLGCYVAALASYFSILTSPSRDGEAGAVTLNPSELRDHEVMETLMECREAWASAKKLRPAKSAGSDTGMLSPPEEEDLEMLDSVPEQPKRKSAKLSKADIKANKKKASEAARKARAVEQSLADLSTLLTSTKTPRSAAAAPAVSAEDGNDDNRSDFGEEELLDAHTAADKARRKKTLKFYTSQIVQKASKRAGAGRDAGGDMDLPYRERFRDRQARLNLEAERRGKKDSKFGAALGGDDSDGDDAAVAKQVRGDEDEYYDMVAHGAQKKRGEKAARYEALAKARRGERVVEAEGVGEDGKRQISYQIQKNKGLTPHRRKEVRNPRVKKRMMFEEKKKKLRSVKAVYKGGEGPGGYQGELSGIKTGLVKSIKL